MNMQHPPGAIRIEAILAAILFNINEHEVIKVKPDDASPEVDMVTSCVGIEKDGEALVCVIPVEKVAKFACLPYKVSTKIDNGHLLICFEKMEQTSGIVTSTGQPVNVESAVIHNLIRKLQLGSEVVNESENPKQDS